MELSEAQARAMHEQMLQEELLKCIKKHLSNYSDNIVRCTILHVQVPAPLLISESNPTLKTEIELALCKFIQGI